MIERLRERADVFRSSLRRQLQSPPRMRGLLIYLLPFVRFFARLMANRLVPLLAKLQARMVQGWLVLLTLPAIELDFIPVIGRFDRLLVISPSNS